MLRSANGQFRMIFIQFMATNPEVFGPEIKAMTPKVPSEGEFGKATGVRLLDLQDLGGFSLVRFIDQIGEKGYTLVTLHYDEKPNPRGKGKRCIARCGFVPSQFAHKFQMNANPDRRTKLMVEISQVCKDSDWTGIRIHDNDYFDLLGEGDKPPTRQLVSGARVLEIGIVGRKPVDPTAAQPRTHLAIVGETIGTVVA